MLHVRDLGREIPSFGRKGKRSLPRRTQPTISASNFWKRQRKGRKRRKGKKKLLAERLCIIKSTKNNKVNRAV